MFTKKNQRDGRKPEDFLSLRLAERQATSLVRGRQGVRRNVVYGGRNRRGVIFTTQNHMPAKKEFDFGRIWNPPLRRRFYRKISAVFD